MFARTLFPLLFATLATFAFLGVAQPNGHAAQASFSLVGKIVNPGGWGFTSTSVSSPGPDLTVMAGEIVTMSLTAADSPIGHNWGVDYNNNQFSDSGEPVSPAFSSSTTPTSYAFTATTTPGTYTYYCFIHHGPMFGRFIVQGPDFSIGANPTTVGPLNNGTQDTSTITISPTNGFTGTVDLTTAPSSGLTANVNPTSISGGSGTSTLTVSASAAGSYTVVVTGTSGSLSHQVTVSVNVVEPDFTITASPTTVGPLNLGAQGASTITIGSLNGFSGSVDLATSPSAGLTAGVNPTPVPGGSGTSTLTVSSGTAGSYSVTVTGTSGSLSHSVLLMVSVAAPDFSLSAAPTLSVSQGSSGSFTLSLQSLAGFSGNVNLTATVTPAGPGLSPVSGTVTLAQGGGGSFVVNVSTGGGPYSTVAAGTYTVRITGVSGSVSHSVDVAVTVTSGAGNLPWAYIIGGATVAAAAAAAVFVVRRGRSKKQ